MNKENKIIILGAFIILCLFFLSTFSGCLDESQRKDGKNGINGINGKDGVCIMGNVSEVNTTTISNLTTIIKADGSYVMDAIPNVDYQTPIDTSAFFLNDCSRELTSDAGIRRENNNSVLYLSGGSYDTNPSIQLGGFDMGGLYGGSIAFYTTGVDYESINLIAIMTSAINGNYPQLDMNYNNISHLAEPTVSDDAATKNYVDSLSFPMINDSYATTANLSLTNDTMGAYVISNITSTNNSMKNYVDTKDYKQYYLNDTSRALTGSTIKRNVDYSNLALYGGTGGSGEGSYITVYGKNDLTYGGNIVFSVPNAAKNTALIAMRIFGNTNTPYLSLNNYKISNVSNPINPQDVTTKNYVDSKQKCGSTGAIANGSAITHGFGSTPTYIIISGTNMSQIQNVISKNSTTFTVSIKYPPTLVDGIADIISWCVG